MGNRETKEIVPNTTDAISDKEEDDFVSLPEVSAIKEQVLAGKNEVPIPPPTVEDQECWPSLSTIQALNSELSAKRTTKPPTHLKNKKKWKNQGRKQKNKVETFRALNGSGKYYNYKNRSQRNSVIQQPI
jgi:hypothetical protein